MRAPSFWHHGSAGALPHLLAPLGHITQRATARRVARPGYLAPVPVVCCGNAGVGGAGKTILVLDLAARLLARGWRVGLLTRGHGGRAAGPLRVEPDRHTAREVGDEAMLLAACAPTYVGADRSVTARLAAADGAQVLLMDDGLQNPTLQKTASLLVVDGAAGFGNGRLLPAGPLREPAAAAAARCSACVLIGADATNALAVLPAGMAVLQAHLVAGPEIAGLAGRSVLAFAGIGRPEKFFDMLAQAGVQLAECTSFADHHRFSRQDLAMLLSQAGKLGAVPVTTPKDLARMDTQDRVQFTVIGVSLAWEDNAGVDAWLNRVLGA